MKNLLVKAVGGAARTAVARTGVVNPVGGIDASTSRSVEFIAPDEAPAPSPGCSRPAKRPETQGREDQRASDKQCCEPID